jgi:hypothetical protein
MLSWLTQSWCLQQHTKLEFKWEAVFRIILGLITQGHFKLQMFCGPWARLIQVFLKTVFKPEYRKENYHNSSREEFSLNTETEDTQG